jgi:hypothetical protein
MGFLFILKNNNRAQSELRVLGQGFFGRVKLCRWLSPHSGELVDVAVKQVLPNASPSSQLQFLVETRILGSLSHPNVVPLLGFSLESCSPLAILEFMPNGDLKVCHFLFCSLLLISMLTTFQSPISAFAGPRLYQRLLRTSPQTTLLALGFNLLRPWRTWKSAGLFIVISLPGLVQCSGLYSMPLNSLSSVQKRLGRQQWHQPNQAG